MAKSDVEWIKNNNPRLKKKKISTLGESVADLVGDLFLGIYHVREATLFHKRTNWSDPGFIELIICNSFSTFDSDTLTRLVFLAHDRLIRVSIDGVSAGYLRLGFSARNNRKEETFYMHPTIEQALLNHRQKHPELNPS